MDDEEDDIAKGSILKQLIQEDLSVHSLVVLKKRVAALKSEIERTQGEMVDKKTAHADADSLFK